VSTIVARDANFKKLKNSMSKAKIGPLKYATKTYGPLGGISEILDTPVNNPDAVER
jgi:hypothetical protein